MDKAYEDTADERKRLKGRLERVEELYEWGHHTQEQYKARRVEIEKQLRTLEPPPEGDTATLDRLASFLKDVALAWEVADYEHRNRLARCLF